jgi:hypothetical protein
MNRGTDMTVQRRDFLKSAGGALAFTLGGTSILLTPQQARARGVPLTVLTEGEAVTLSAFGEAVVPGAQEAGLIHFVDHQLAASPHDALILARMLGVEPPYRNFYRAALAAIDALANTIHGKRFADLDIDAAEALVGTMTHENPQGWLEGMPPAPFVYTLFRSDAVDVVYGTVEGFAKLGVPYMPHILPPEPW